MPLTLIVFSHLISPASRKKKSKYILSGPISFQVILKGTFKEPLQGSLKGILNVFLKGIVEEQLKNSLTGFLKDPLKDSPKDALKEVSFREILKQS